MWGMWSGHGRLTPITYPGLCYPVNGQAKTEKQRISREIQGYLQTGLDLAVPSGRGDMPAEGLEPPTP
jgi:hypothetical protein